MSLLVQRAADIPWQEIGTISTLGLSANALRKRMKRRADNDDETP